MSRRPRSAALQDAGPPVEWTVPDLVGVFARRRAWILASVGICSATALLCALCATPRYRASAVIEVRNQSHGAFGLDNTTADAQTASTGDSFDENLTLQTEIGILQADAVALDVIHRTGLENTPDYFAPRPSHFAWLQRLFFWRKPLEPLIIPLADAPNRRYIALDIFAKRSKIAPAAGTRLISISYADPDPARAAAVVNEWVESLADYSYHSRSSAAAQSAIWLQSQLAGLKQQTEALDARAALLDRQTGAFGDDDAHNVVLARLDEFNAALSAAQSNRIVREAIWRAVQSGDPEVISGLGGDAGAGTNTQNSFALLQSLRSQEAAAKSQIAESADRYGENWPALAEQRAGLATIQKSIQDEVHRLGDRARNDYQVALQAENSARAAFDQQRAVAAGITGNAMALRLARQEADASRTLYTSLQNRLQQTGVLEGLHPGNFIVVTPALAPPSDHPSSPNLPLLAALALAGGLTIGCIAAIARELTDKAVHTAADLEALLETPVFAELPSPQTAPHPMLRRLSRMLRSGHSADLALEAAAASDFGVPVPSSPWAESLHRLRASLLLAHSGRAPQVIAISATVPERPRKDGSDSGSIEEKQPSVALSLAAVLAQHGAPVLYVDADMRSAPLGGVFPVAAGLSNALAGDRLPEYEHPSLTPPLLSVLSAGARPPCAAELIASRRMRSLLAEWRHEFMFIVIDAPAAVYADALVLAQQADAVLLAARAGATHRELIATAFDALSRQVPDHAVLGIILENVRNGGAYAHA